MAHREFSHKQNEIQRRKKKELEKVPRKRNRTPAFRSAFASRDPIFSLSTQKVTYT
jgi:hypothetical protein